MTIAESYDLKPAPANFLKLETVELYGMHQPIYPDRVYRNDKDRLVAFFSASQCSSIQQYVRDAANCFYYNNRAMLFTSEPDITLIMNNEYLKQASKSWSGMKFLKNAISIGIQAGIVKTLKALNEKSRKVFENMYNRAETCHLVNSVAKTQTRDYFSDEIKQYFCGVEMEFGHRGRYYEPGYFTSETKEQFPPPNTIQDVLHNLSCIELLFKEGIKQNSNGMKNAACAELSRVDKIFHNMFEKVQKYSYLLTDIVTQDQIQAILARKYINFLVVTYRWMNATLNLFDTGPIECVTIMDPKREVFYLTKDEVNCIADRIKLKIAITICRHDNKFNLDGATEEVINSLLNSTKSAIDANSKKSDDLTQEIEDLGEKLQKEAQKFATDTASSITSAASAGSVGSISPPNFDVQQFLDLYFQKVEKEEQLKAVLKELTENYELREMLFVHIQIEIVKKFVSKFTAILLSIEAKSPQEHIYEIQAFY